MTESDKINFQALDLEEPQARAARVLHGRILSIDRGTNSADVEVTRYAEGYTEILKNVSVHYNCECGESFDLGHLAFITNAEDTDPQTKTSYCLVLETTNEQGVATHKIIGFRDGLPRRCFSCDASRGQWPVGDDDYPDGEPVEITIKAGCGPYDWTAYDFQNDRYEFRFDARETEGRTNSVTPYFQTWCQWPHAVRMFVLDSCLEEIECYFRVGCPKSAEVILVSSVYSDAEGCCYIDTWKAKDGRSYYWTVEGSVVEQSSGQWDTFTCSSEARVKQPSCASYTLKMKCANGVDPSDPNVYTYQEMGQATGTGVPTGTHIHYSTTLMSYNPQTSQTLSSSDGLSYKWTTTGGGGFSADTATKTIDSASSVTFYSTTSNSGCTNNSTVKILCGPEDTVVDTLNIRFSNTSQVGLYAYKANSYLPGANPNTTYFCGPYVPPNPTYQHCVFNTGATPYRKYDCFGTLLSGTDLDRCSSTGSEGGVLVCTTCVAAFNYYVGVNTASCGAALVDKRTGTMITNGCCPEALM